MDDGVATPLKDQAFHLYDMLLRQWPQANPPGGWYVQNRGGLPPTASPEALQLADQVMARLEVPARMAASHRQRLQCCDIEDLQFSDAMLDDFIAAVKEAQKVSKRVDVLLMPRNQDVVHLSQRRTLDLAPSSPALGILLSIQKTNANPRTFIACATFSQQ